LSANILFRNFQVEGGLPCVGELVLSLHHYLNRPKAETVTDIKKKYLCFNNFSFKHYWVHLMLVLAITGLLLIL